MSFPTTLDDLTSSDPSHSDNLGTGKHSDLHIAERAAIDALETKLGINSSAVTTTHDYKLSGVTGTDKASSLAGTESLTNKTLTTPVIASLYIDAGLTKQMTFPNVSSDTVAVIAAAQTLTNKTLTSPTINTPIITTPTIRNWDGWEDANETWVYASATTITVPSGAASKYAIGDRIKLTQTTVKYFYIIGVADTLLTITGGSSYTLVSAAISANYYSKVANPVGWPGWFNWTVVFAGFSADPSNYIARFRVIGRQCHIQYGGGTAGTSNAANFTISAPIAAASTNYSFGSARVKDNGTWQAAQGMLYIAQSETVFTHGKTMTAAAGFTTSGTKDSAFILAYEI